ncbi:MAG TPA: ATP-binding protein [Terriglobia bacterium]|nr:ATP-binding protein [Terriglobia bacterium]
MRLSLKAKLTALISLLVLMVVVAISVLYCSALIQHTLLNVSGRANDITKLVFEQSRQALNVAPVPPGTDFHNPDQVRNFLHTALNGDSRLVSLLESTATFSESLEYVTITDGSDHVLLQNTAGEDGQKFPAAPPFSQLSKGTLVHQLQAIYGHPRLYEVVFPIKFGEEPMNIRVGVSTVLLRGLLKPELSRAFRVSLAAILLSTLTAGLLSFLVLRPLESISLSVERMARGELPGPVPVSRSDEWGILSSKLNLLGERLRGEKAAFVALKENLDQLLGNLADGLMFFDQQDRLVLATPAVARFMNRPADEILRQTPAEIFSDDDELSRLLRSAFVNRRSVSGQMVGGSNGSQTGTVAVSLVFVEEEGATVASLVTLRDAETRAQLESQIDTAAKLAAIGRLTAGVAHEVRNPLNAMILQLEVLRAKLGEQAEAVNPQLEILSSEIRRLDRVVRTFLDFTRPVELHPVETDVEALIEDVFRSAQPDAVRHQVRLVLDRNGSSKVRVDRDLMKQALLNLVLNGCQAMPSGGELKVSTHTQARQVEIEIEDQGVGIPLEARSRVFALYYTTKPSGSGIGLAMSYRIVQLHNGTLDFSSEVNRGTVFRLALPC